MKNRLFAGAALMAIAFTGAAFTANSTLQANHYVQKANSCDPIPTTECDLEAANPCLETDTSGTWQVFESQNASNPRQCETPLQRPD